MSIADIRQDYGKSTLLESNASENPFEQFQAWFNHALEMKVKEVNAMTLATVNSQGRPASRIVLLKDFDTRGFTWFTNYSSAKGEELAIHPFASLLFFWADLERQVRIEGRIEKLSDQENDEYFYSRPLGSQQSACASKQSQIIPDRDALELQLAQVIAEMGDQPKRPTHWGGYRLIPDRLEFWQGRSSRLHDRLVYTFNQSNWERVRLQP